jgi:hypothetical protein
MKNKKWAVALMAATIITVFSSHTAICEEKENTQQTAVEKNKTESQKSDTLFVIARIVEIAGKFAPNDLYNYVYIMKYRIIKVERGTYAGKEILVGHYNPLIHRKKIKDNMDAVVDGDVTTFEVGNKHKLVLITPLEKVWNGAVDDEYIDSDLEKYFALKTDIAK